MAKNKPSDHRSSPPPNGARSQSSPDASESPQAKDAEEQVRFAKEQLHKAELYYEEVLSTAREQTARLRRTTIGEVIDEVLEFVKRHPGAGVLSAAALGFFLGRLFRR